MWIGTEGGGLNKYDKNKNEFIQYKNKICQRNRFQLKGNVQFFKRVVNYSFKYKLTKFYITEFTFFEILYLS